MSEEMIERVAAAIENVQLFVRYNDFTADSVAGLPNEVCRYCEWGKGQDGEDIEVIARFPATWDQSKEIPEMVNRLRAVAAIEASGVSDLLRTATAFIEELKAFGYGESSEKALPGAYDPFVRAVNALKD